MFQTTIQKGTAFYTESSLTMSDLLKSALRCLPPVQVFFGFGSATPQWARDGPLAGFVCTCLRQG